MKAGLEDRVAELRARFDRSFAEPEPDRRQDHLQLLSIRAGGDRYLLRVPELAGILAGRTLLPLPSDVREFRGVIGVRGAVVPVFSLSLLLGGAAADEGQWMALAGGQPAFALSFERYEGQLRVDPGELVSHGSRTPLLAQAAPIDGTLAPVLDLNAVRAALEARGQNTGERG